MIIKNILVFLLAFCPLVSNSQVNEISFVINGGINNINLKKTIESNTSELLMKLNEAYQTDRVIPKLDSKGFSQRGLEAVSDLWNGEHFYCYSNYISENIFTKHVDTSATKVISFQVRNIPVIFGESDSLSLVIDYLPDGRIDDLHSEMALHIFYLPKNVEGQIDKTTRQIILNFIENLRTYYLRKDIDNIEKLYSDKTLIIVGKVLDTANNLLGRLPTNIAGSQVNYLVRTKKEYIDTLREVFNNTSGLLVNFKNIEVTREPKNKNFYLVRLFQTVITANYDNMCWVSLFIQFRENEQPLIWVRTIDNELAI